MSGPSLRRGLEIFKQEGIKELSHRFANHIILSPLVEKTIQDLTVLTGDDLVYPSQAQGEVYLIPADSISPDENDIDPYISSSLTYSDRILCEFPNVQLMGRRGLRKIQTGEVIFKSQRRVESHITNEVRSALPYLYFATLSPNNFRKYMYLNLRSRSNRAMSMIMHTETHYGHWIIEYLPKLYHLYKYENYTGKSPDIIIEKDPPLWMTQSLKLLGYEPDRFIEWNNKFAEIDHLLVPISSDIGGDIKKINLSPVEFRWIRETSTKQFTSTSTSDPSGLYISRQGMDRRFVENFEEIKELLEEYNFAIIRPEEDDFITQVRQFAEADIIVGGFGSGLHNMIFSSDAEIIEFFPPAYENDNNYALSAALGHTYRSISGRSPNKSWEIQEPSKKETPYRIVYDELESEIQSALDNIQNP